MAKNSPGEQPKDKELDISGLMPSTEMQIDGLAVETLAGDVRDVLLTHYRSQTIPWGHLGEDEQGDKIEAFDKCARDVVRRAVAMLTTVKFPVLHVQIGKWTVDKAIEMKVTAGSTVGNINLLAEHGNSGAVLVLAEAADYMGERAPAKPDPNQRPLFDEDTGEVRD
jgi:hypothetical protein